MKRGKIKLFVAGLAISAVCILAPHSTEAAVPKAQMDGVMGQSIEDEMVYHDTAMDDSRYSLLKSAIALFSATSTRAASPSYTDDFLASSFAAMRFPVTRTCLT